ncbi:MAG: hypothetical protein ACERK6_08610 [Candidatus Aminicenantaceae bacterium]
MDDKEIKITLAEALFAQIEKEAAGQSKSVEDLIVGLLQEKYPAEAGMSLEEEDKVKERLKALGYMD